MSENTEENPNEEQLEVVEEVDIPNVKLNKNGKPVSFSSVPC